MLGWHVKGPEMAEQHMQTLAGHMPESVRPRRRGNCAHTCTCGQCTHTCPGIHGHKPRVRDIQSAPRLSLVMEQQAVSLFFLGCSYIFQTFFSGRTLML